VKPKYNLYSAYQQCNHIHSPTAFDWVYDGTGSIDFYVDAAIPMNTWTVKDKPRIAIMVEPRTIQPEMYNYIMDHYKPFDIIFTHDDEVLKLPNAKLMYFMNWYESFNVPKTKNISMVCSDKVMCEEHKRRQELADILGDRVDHYGMYKGGRFADYYECRAEYRFEVVVDNYWEGHWACEKLSNPLASKTVPIYLSGKHIPDDIDTNGIIIADKIEDIPQIVDEVLENPIRAYMDRLNAIDRNYNIIRRYKVFEDWLYSEYKDLLEDLT